MKTLLIYHLLSLSIFGNDILNSTITEDKINTYRNSHFTTPTIKVEDSTELDQKLSSLRMPYQKLPYYVWGLLKAKNQKYISITQVEQLEILVEKFKKQRGRLHDERNWCRLMFTMASYSYALAEGENKQAFKSKVEFWLEQWLKFKKDEDYIQLKFIKDEWQIFTKEQKQKIIKHEWTHITKPLKDYERKFSGDKQLWKAFKFKNQKDWQTDLDNIHNQFKPLRDKYLEARTLYNLSYFYIDEIPSDYARLKAKTSSEQLSQIFLFTSESMRELMNRKMTKENKNELKSKLTVFLDKLYRTSYEKYYDNGQAKGLIDLVKIHAHRTWLYRLAP